jgi:hypothetical protein
MYVAGLGSRSLVLDAAGHPHLAFGGDSIYYAWHDGTAWHTEVVDDTYVGPGSPEAYTSLALDSAGRPHIAYTRLDCNGPTCSPRSLKYARFDGLAWQIETLDNGCWSPSLALDAADHPHISYYGGTTSDVKYAYFDGSAWQIEVVYNSVSSYVSDTSLALDSAGRPHIAYGYEALYYAWYSGTTWYSETVTGTASVSSPSLALDAADRPHVSYDDLNNADLKYAHFDGTEWQVVTLDSQAGQTTSLALDAAGRPHISYSSSSAQLKYAYSDGLSWYLETVDTGVGLSSLALDTAGRPHIAYDDDPLRYASFDGVSWQIQTVQERGEMVGTYTSLALDTAGRPHIAYCRLVPRAPVQICGGLKYAHQDGSGWHVEAVDSGGNGASLALDSAGHPHISYYGSNRTNLRYAYHDGAAWHFETLDTSGSLYLGCDTSLALDAADHPHIAYCDDAAYGLKYAYHDGTAWHVESLGEYGFYPSLALGAEDRPRISYCRGSCSVSCGCDGLAYTYYDGSAWQIEMVDGTTGAGSSTSLALDPTGWPQISYQADDSLRFAYLDTTGWHTATLDSSGGAGWYTSLALDANGWAHISYYDADHSNLKYAYWDGIAWQFETADSSAHVGRYTSLALDAAGDPHISYYDNARYDLLYSYQKAIAVSGVNISGPALLPAGGMGVYTATYTPFDATPPVTITWNSGAVGPTAGYNWTEPGIYTIIATATNAYGQAQGAFTVTVFCQAVEGVEIHGPDRLPVGIASLYTVTYTPTSPSPPITVTWSNGTMGPGAAYSWTLTGTHTLAVTASNGCGQAQDSFTVTTFCQPPEAAQLTGPLTLPVNQVGVYQAAVLPITTSPPITFTWDNGADEATAVYSWTVTGTHTLYLTASNGCGAAQGSFTVTVFCQAVTGVAADGPRALLVGQVGTYHAAAQPITASRPLTFTWDNGTMGDAAAYSWPTTGTYTLTVSATNACGGVRTASLPVAVLAEWPYGVYLPLVLRGP